MKIHQDMTSEKENQSPGMARWKPTEPKNDLKRVAHRRSSHELKEYNTQVLMCEVSRGLLINTMEGASTTCLLGGVFIFMQ